LAEARRVAALHPHVAKPEAESLPPGERSLIGLVNYVVGKDAPAPKLAPPPASGPARASAPARADAVARPTAGQSRPTNLMGLLGRAPTPASENQLPAAKPRRARAAAKAPKAKTRAVTSTSAESPPELLPLEIELQPRRMATGDAAPSPAPVTAAPKEH